MSISPRRNQQIPNDHGGVFKSVVMGYCPGTIAGAIGNGYLDALTAGLVGIVPGSGLPAAIMVVLLCVLEQAGH